MSTDSESLYTVLEVDENASVEDIRRSYKRLAMTYHPDKTGGDEMKSDHFKRVSDAYAVLSNPLQREAYDCRRQSSGGGGIFHFADLSNLSDLSDIMTVLFETGAAEGLLGRGGGGGGKKAATSADPVLHLTLAQLMTGGSYTIQAPGPCSACAPRTAGDVSSCSGCDGRGLLMYSLFDMRACSVCDGTGFSLRNCGVCNSTRVALTSLTIDMDPGIPDSTQIPLPGGLLLRVVFDLPSGVRLDEKGTLHIDVDITWAEWLCGFEKNIIVDRNMDPLHIVSSGPGFPYEHPYIVKGRGLPQRGTTERHPLVLHFHVAYPTPRTLTKLVPVFRKLFRLPAPSTSPRSGDIVIGSL